jgi:pimeloyl-ACP methyl ester carboxylesterase
MWRLAAGIVLCSGLIALAQPLWAQNFAADIPLGSGGNERVLFASAANPRATLIMFPGGSGIVGVSASGTTTNLNFLVRTLPLWLAQGFAVEILDAPNGASLLGQRHTSGYAAAIDRAIDFARSRANAPVWLVGTSQGSTAAANGAAHLGGKIAGVVLLFGDAPGPSWRDCLRQRARPDRRSGSRRREPGRYLPADAAW